MVRILINVCRNQYRRKRRELAVESVPERAAPPDADPDLHDAVLRLPEALRLPLVLHYMEGYGVFGDRRNAAAPGRHREDADAQGPFASQCTRSKRR